MGRHFWNVLSYTQHQMTRLGEDTTVALLFSIVQVIQKNDVLEKAGLSPGWSRSGFYGYL